MAKVPVRKAAKVSRRATPARPESPPGGWEREFDRLFEDVFRRRWPSLWHPERWLPRRMLDVQVPAVDIYEDKDEVVVKAELPGMVKDEVEVNLSGSTLTIKGEKKKQEEVKDHDYYRCERSYGSFTRSFELPTEVKVDAVAASFKDGILEIRLPKTEEGKKKQVKVEVK
jgi:HSP20 family protein